MQCITLTTDFGQRDGFVGIMKGVILTRAPRARVLDITHDLPPGDVRAAAFVLMNAHRYFPAGTVHVAVVDPGVGGPRRALVARTPRAFYVGPDNGVLSWALSQDPPLEARWIENPKLFLHPVSQTFHGRDVFAPVAAYLCRGGQFSRVGPKAHDWIRLPQPGPLRLSPGVAAGEILYVDRFGNAITNLSVKRSPEAVPCIEGAFVVKKRSSIRFPARAFYGAVAPGRPVAVPGSSGFWELAIHGGSAAEKHKLRPGDPVEWRSEQRGHDCPAGPGQQ